MQIKIGTVNNKKRRIHIVDNHIKRSMIIFFCGKKASSVDDIEYSIVEVDILKELGGSLCKTCRKSYV
ncbi:hypothetical protein KAR91_66360 [Candidatus Pacearchaeota archaeon]|nr:hypothetical protein [Candidatus Pacearchaeota archaeon]